MVDSTQFYNIDNPIIMSDSKPQFDPYKADDSGDYRVVAFEREYGRRRTESVIKEIAQLLANNEKDDQVFEKFSELLKILKENEINFETYEKEFAEKVYEELVELNIRDSNRVNTLVKQAVDASDEQENLLHIWLSLIIIQQDIEAITKFIDLLSKESISEIARDHFGFIIYMASQKQKDSPLAAIPLQYINRISSRVFSYYRRVNTHLRMKSVAYDVVSDAKKDLNEKIDKSLEKIHQTIDYKYNYLQKQRDEDIESIAANIKFSDNKFNEELKSQSKSNIQLLSLFTAVLAFVIVNVQVFTNYTFIGALFLCIALGLGLINFIVVIDILVNKERWEAKYKIGLVIALLVALLAMPFFAQRYYMSIPSNIFVQDKEPGDVIIQAQN